MKAFSPKSASETPRVAQDRRPLRRGMSAEENPRTGFVDGRPEAVAQRQLRAGVERSPRVRRLVERQAMIITSPRQAAQRQQTVQMFGHGTRGSTAVHGTGGVVQLAGTKPNQPSADGKYRIKLSSDREQFSYENRVSLGLDAVLPQHHRLFSYFHYEDGNVTAVRLIDGTKVPLKAPIPPPSDTKKLLCIDTVGYQDPRRDDEELEGDRPQAKKLFIDIKIGHYTKSGQQWALEGAGWFMQVFKQVEHDMKDVWRTSDVHGYDIDAENLEKFNAAHDSARSGGEPTLKAAMRAIHPSLLTIRNTMAAAPVTFVGASVFIVLNLTTPQDSAVKIIDPDHPILLDSPPGLGNVPADVMTRNKMQGGRAWNAYKNKWQANFGSGMTNFVNWFAVRHNELPAPRRRG